MKWNTAFENENPVAWVVGEAGGLCSLICDLLASFGCKVLLIDGSSPLSPLPKPAYIFYLNLVLGKEESLSILEARSFEVKQLFHLAESLRAKMLLAVGDSAASRFARKKVRGWEKTKSTDVRIVRLDNLYGPGIDKNSSINDLLQSVLKKRRMKEHRLGKVRPLFVADAARGILAAMFGSGTRGREFRFNAPEVSLSRLRDFIVLAAASKDGPADEKEFSGETLDFNFSPTPLDVGLRRTIAYFESTKGGRETSFAYFKGRRGSGSVNQKLSYSPSLRLLGRVRSRLSILPKNTTFFVASLLFILASPFILLALSGGLLKLGAEQLRSGDFARSRQIFLVSSTLFGASHSFLSQASGLLIVGGFLDRPRDAGFVGKLASDMAIQAAVSANLGRSVLEGIFGQTPVSPGAFSKLAAEIEQLGVMLGFLETYAKKGEIPKIDSQLAHLPSLFSVSSLAKEAPDLLGMGGEKNYLVLFQNNMEVRPTGGLIGSFGIFTFKDGKLKVVEIQDVYTADGQLAGHVEPPGELKKHLGEANWFLRDSNWSPDFPTSARRAQWFLEKELDKKVDGVIAVDLEFVKKLLDVLGEIEVVDFGERVNSRNFYEVLSRRTEVGFFPGSTQKNDFLTSLNRSLVRELTQNISPKTIPLGGAIFASLAERHALIFLNDKKEQEIVDRLEWGGRLIEPECGDGECAKDYLMVVDANVGVNKANYFTSRSFLLDVAFSPALRLGGPARLSHKLYVSYRNGGSKTEDRYKAYVRFYLPKGALGFEGFYINDKSNEKVGLPADKFQEKGKDVFGALVEVGPGENSRFLFSWGTPVDSAKIRDVSFLWQKQPGTNEDPLVLRFWPAKGSSLSLISEASPPTQARPREQASLTSGEYVGYTTTLREDLDVKISLGQKEQ